MSSFNNLIEGIYSAKKDSSYLIIYLASKCDTNFSFWHFSKQCKDYLTVPISSPSNMLQVVPHHWMLLKPQVLHRGVLLLDGCFNTFSFICLYSWWVISQNLVIHHVVSMNMPNNRWLYNRVHPPFDWYYFSFCWVSIHHSHEVSLMGESVVLGYIVPVVRNYPWSDLYSEFRIWCFPSPILIALSRLNILVTSTHSWKRRYWFILFPWK